MTMTTPFRSSTYHSQMLNDDGIRWSAPASNILVTDRETGRKLRLEDPQGYLIKEYKGRRVVK